MTTTKTTTATVCGYTPARRGQINGACPACGERPDEHVRECVTCGDDIEADDVDDCIDADGSLVCEDCYTAARRDEE